MNYIAFLILRRLRTPLIALIIVYSILVLGYVLIPGEDSNGDAYRMSFMNAFYFVSFMGSTIGFGELPHAFTPMQRFWTIFAIYASVITWVYGIGAVVTIFRDESFIRLLQRGRFRYRVNAGREPYFIICGYGLTGSNVVEKMAKRGIRCVVIDINAHRLEALELDNLPFDVPGICGDASDPGVLNDAGIEGSNCIGMICLTNDDHANLSIAITSKLLKPGRLVISRVASQAYARNLASFGTEHILDPFEIFSDYLDSAIHHPYQHLIYDWLVSPAHRAVPAMPSNSQGTWVICGYGRFGKALKKRFDAQGIQTVIIEPEPEERGLAYPDVYVDGLGTEADTLLEANITEAVGIIAGSADDANNLSIIMTARELNPKLFMIARQNHHLNQSVFEAASVDMVMDPKSIITNHILAILKTPLLIEFINRLSSMEESWCRSLTERLEEIVGNKELDSWSLQLDESNMPAVCGQIRADRKLTLRHLMYHPYRKDKFLPCVPLLIKRENKIIMLPSEVEVLHIGDEILFGGLSYAASWMLWLVKNDHDLEYVLTGKDEGGYLWERWTRSYFRKQKKGF